MRIVVVGIAALLVGCGLLQGSGPSGPAATPASALASIAIGRTPTLLAVSPDGARVYATSIGRLTIIDARTNAVANTASIDPYASGLTPAPDGGTVLLTTLASGRLTLLSAASGAPTGSISLPTSLQPGGYGRSAVAADGKTAWVVNEDEWLASVDLTAQTARQRPLDLRPHDVAVSRDGTNLYVAGCRLYCSNGTVEVLDTVGYETQRTLTVGAAPFRVALSPDGRHLYTTSGGNPILSAVDLSTGTVDATVTVGAQPTGLAVSPDGATIYVASYATGTLAVVRAADHALLRTVQLQGSARDVAVSPDGGRVYVSTANPNAVVVFEAAQLVRR